MLGTIYVVYDQNIIINNINKAKIILVMDSPEYCGINIPGAVGGSILMPSGDMLEVLIEGDQNRFEYLYMNYLSNGVPDKFISVILTAILSGTNIIFFMDKESKIYEDVLRTFIANQYGILIGGPNIQFSTNSNRFPYTLNKLYCENYIDANMYLNLLPPNIKLESIPAALSKLVSEIGIYDVEYLEAIRHNDYISPITRMEG